MISQKITERKKNSTCSKHVPKIKKCFRLALLLRNISLKCEGEWKKTSAILHFINLNTKNLEHQTFVNFHVI